MKERDNMNINTELEKYLLENTPYKHRNIFNEILKHSYNACTYEMIRQIIIDSKPKAIHQINMILIVLKGYAEHTANLALQNILVDIDKKDIWQEIKSTIPGRYISYALYEDIYTDIGLDMEMNAFYIQTLFRCLYEGIYNTDLSVLKNLKAADIKGNVVSLIPDNAESYELEISWNLAEDLIDLSRNNDYERRNKYGLFTVKAYGLSPDSCFKLVSYKDSKYAYNRNFTKIIRKIAEEYLPEYIEAGNGFTAAQIYISGIMYRIRCKLEDNQITLQDAFAFDNRDRNVHKIIETELIRSHYQGKVKDFRKNVSSYLSDFD